MGQGGSKGGLCGLGGETSSEPSSLLLSVGKTGYGYRQRSSKTEVSSSGALMVVFCFA